MWLNFPRKVSNNCNSPGSFIQLTNSILLDSGDSDTKEHTPPTEDMFHIANKWVATCQEDHHLCKPHDDSILPSRLVSVINDPPQLVLTKNWTTKPRYATLSHCWGNKPFLMLTMENLDSLLVAIPIDELPKTFKDAIEITRKLGLEYLWVDSLCIIQRHEEDWLKESAMMSSIYGGTTVTIAASSAIDVHQGCFLKPQFFRGGFYANVMVNGQRSMREFLPKEVYERSTTYSQLATRAWALQERCLAPRTIHFGNRGAFWEFRTKIASEFCPSGFNNLLVNPLICGKTAMLKSSWNEIVHLYSAATLTYGKDKLPALSGIARMAYDESNDQYLAGVWKENVEEQLCWASLTAQKRPAYRAPSWSWTSVDGGVMYQKGQRGVLEDRYAHLLDAKMTLLGLCPFGQVTAGEIRIACSGMLKGNLSKLNRELVGRVTGVPTMINFADGEKPVVVKRDCIDTDHDKDNDMIYLLPIVDGWSGNSHIPEIGGDYIDEFVIRGILLRPTGATRGQFYRIGSFNFFKDHQRFDEDEEEHEECRDLFLRLLEDSGAKIAESVCAEVISNAEHPKETYVISVI